MSVKRIKIGTRGSPLALKQVEMVCAALVEKHPDMETETVVIKTSGDWSPEQGETRLVEEQGGKGQFAKEIEEALLAGAIDIAVHSMKDMESTLPKGLKIACTLPREDARDCLLINKLANNSQKISELPEGAVIGTASVRRQAFLLAQNSGLKAVPFRGNVQTRIEKLRSGQVDITVLALAGLKRLGLENEADIILGTSDMLPAAGQGAVGIEIREDDTEMEELLATINCRDTFLCVSAEREVLRILDGSCHTPIGAHAVMDSGEMILKAMLAALDGSESYAQDARGPVETPEQALALGRSVGEALKAAAPEYLLKQRAA